MASSLRAKLMAMGAAREQPPSPAKPGLKIYTHAEAAPEGLYALSERALWRMGAEYAWPGIEKCLFFDTETTGLAGAGTVAFLCGIGWVENGRFFVEQFLLGDYPDEPEMLLRLAQRMERFSVLVTFNGRTFDWPLIEGRFTMLRLRERFPHVEQLDLLPPARRLWKRRLHSVRLSVLEKEVLRRGRMDDLPGSEAPDRYFTYLKTGDLTGLEDVIRHNRLDILSLGSLLVCLNEAYQTPDGQEDVLDLVSMARALEKRGEKGEALRCYRAAALPRPALTISALRAERAGAMALCEMGRMHRQAGDYESAMSCFLQAVRREGGVRPLIELAKIEEHRTGNWEQALFHTERALLLTEDRDRPALEKRRARLLQKITKCGRNGL